jgi:hypothetical protein
MDNKNIDIFNTKFDKFKTLRDKFESQFMIICHNISFNNLVNKIKYQTDIIKTVKNDYKRKYLLAKINFINIFLNNLQEKTQEESPDKKLVFNSVFFITKNETIKDIKEDIKEDIKVIEIILEKEWIELLKEFSVDNYIFKYGEFFDLDYLEHLLLNKIYHDVIHVNNNVLLHYQFNKTKKKLLKREEKKALDLNNYLKTNIKIILIMLLYTGL